MSDLYNLQRFVDAQDDVFPTALAELKAGNKQSHWMWFIFPQLAGLGRSPTAQYFGISSLEEARAYLGHSPLGSRLEECVHAILEWSGRRTAEQIFGPVDAMKLRSSLTLFNAVDPGHSFEKALREFFGGVDESTLALLEDER